ncbi:MAG: hypothetical protein IPG87_15950 [Saprospiraceae bacterium]|nr:hypothetical protein [Candidatus Vicinibacter affinis]
MKTLTLSEIQYTENFVRKFITSFLFVFWTIVAASGQIIIKSEHTDQDYGQAENFLQFGKYLEADSLVSKYLIGCENHFLPEICLGRCLSLQARVQYGLKNYSYSDELFRKSIRYLRRNIDACYFDYGNTVVRYFFLLNRDNKKDSARLLLEESRSYYVLQNDTLSKSYAGVIGMLGHVNSLLNDDSLALFYFKEWKNIVARNA